MSDSLRQVCRFTTGNGYIAISGLPIRCKPVNTAPYRHDLRFGARVAPPMSGKIAAGPLGTGSIPGSIGSHEREY